MFEKLISFKYYLSELKQIKIILHRIISVVYLDEFPTRNLDSNQPRWWDTTLASEREAGFLGWFFVNQSGSIDDRTYHSFGCVRWKSSVFRVVKTYIQQNKYYKKYKSFLYLPVRNNFKQGFIPVTSFNHYYLLACPDLKKIINSRKCF